MSYNYVPVGAIVAVLQNSSSPSDRWLYCNGNTFDTDLYPELASLLGTNVLPNLIGLTIIGAGINTAGTTYAQSSQYGNETVKLSLSQMPSHTHYGWGENANATTGLGFGTSSKNGYYGNNQHDSDNYLYAATFAGGIGTNNIPVTYNDNGTEISSTTSSSWTDNQAFSVMQKSYAINYFIFGGA